VGDRGENEEIDSLYAKKDYFGSIVDLGGREKVRNFEENVSKRIRSNITTRIRWRWLAIEIRWK
jgi:hypothetical protein